MSVEETQCRGIGLCVRVCQTLSVLPGVLEALATRPKDKIIWRCDTNKYGDLLQKVAELGGLQNMQVHPYRLRQGRASYDALARRRKIDEIKCRGRWWAKASGATKRLDGG